MSNVDINWQTSSTFDKNDILTYEKTGLNEEEVVELGNKVTNENNNVAFEKPNHGIYRERYLKAVLDSIRAATERLSRSTPTEKLTLPERFAPYGSTSSLSLDKKLVLSNSFTNSETGLSKQHKNNKLARDVLQHLGASDKKAVTEIGQKPRKLSLESLISSFTGVDSLSGFIARQKEAEKNETPEFEDTKIMRLQYTKEPKLKPKKLLYPYEPLKEKHTTYRGYPIEGHTFFKENPWIIQIVGRTTGSPLPPEPLPLFPEQDILTRRKHRYRSGGKMSLSNEEKRWNSGELFRTYKTDSHWAA